MAGALCAAAAGIPAGAQNANWPTDGFNQERTHWQTDEHIISPANASEIRLLWKIQLDNKPRAMTSLLPPLIAAHLPTASGDKQVAIVAGVSNNVYSIDVATGALLWTKHFEAAGESSFGGTLCPGGLTDTPYLSAPDAAGHRTLYFMTGEGKLHQLDASTGAEKAAAIPFMGPNGKPFSLNFFNDHLYTVNGQYCGRQTDGVWGIDLKTGKVSVWSTDENAPVWSGTRLYPPGVWGRAGVSVGPHGTVYASSSDGDWSVAKKEWALTMVALDPGTLQMKDWYEPRAYEWMNKKDLDLNTTPIVFPYQGRELVAMSGKGGRLYLMDAHNLGGADHRTPLDRTPTYANQGANYAGRGSWGTLATWQDAAGTRWILAPFWGPADTVDVKFPISHGPNPDGGVVAFKVEERNGHPALVPGWISQDMVNGEAPVVANGVVYAYGSGENTVQAFASGTTRGPGDYRIEHSTHATLFALDGETGTTLWSSGDQIKSWVHSGGLSVANGRVYLGTYDSILYSFGITPGK